MRSFWQSATSAAIHLTRICLYEWYQKQIYRCVDLSKYVNCHRYRGGFCLISAGASQYLLYRRKLWRIAIAMDHSGIERYFTLFPASAETFAWHLDRTWIAGWNIFFHRFWQEDAISHFAWHSADRQDDQIFLSGQMVQIYETAAKFLT